MIRKSLVLAVLLSAVPLHAQFQATIDVKLVEVDVVVTDREGKRVHGLTADDFEIFEGRTPQKITNFTEYREQAVPDASSPSSSAPAEQKRPPQSLLILIDRLTREGNSRDRELENLDQLVANLMRQGDRASIVYWLPNYERAEPIVTSTDPAVIRAALRRLSSHETAPGAAASLAQDSTTGTTLIEAEDDDITDKEAQRLSTEFFGGEMDLMLFRRRTRALNRLIQSFGHQEGRKTLLYVAQEFIMPASPLTRQAAISHLDDVVKSANANGVTIYMSGHSSPSENGAPDDPPERRMRKIDVMEHLTIPTGGKSDFGPISVATLGKTIVEDAGSYYSLAYQARSDGKDRERGLTVKTKNRDYRVRARTSFVEKSKETVGRDLVLAGIFGGGVSNDLEFRVQHGEPQKTGKNRWTIPVAVSIPSRQLEFAEEGRERVARVRIIIASANGVAEVTPFNEDDLRVVSGKDDPRGLVTYTVQIVANERGSDVGIGVLDRRSGRAGVHTFSSKPVK